MVQVQDNKNDVGTIKQINKTYKHSMREVTETDSPSLLFILVYLVFEATDTWQYIKQQKMIDRINLLIYIYLYRQIEVIAQHLHHPNFHFS